ATAGDCFLRRQRADRGRSDPGPMPAPTDEVALLDSKGSQTALLGCRSGRDMTSSIAMRRVAAVAGLLAASLPVLRASSARAEGENGWGFSESNLDRSCKPCDDFNQFAMGGWMKNNPIPAEYPNWGSFTMLADRNQTVLRGILEAAAKTNAAAGSNQQKIG